jgi:prolyl-tRNA editing enzyme YbaK/EbsC (Cys-tRNA(Pro) deacylase)
MTCVSPEQILAQAKIPFRVFTHLVKPDSLQVAAFERHQQPDQIIRTILFRKERNEFLIVLTPGGKQIPWNKLREKFHLRRITTATRDEVLFVTGYEPGTVSPLGLPVDLPVYYDRTIAQKKEISFGSGEANKALILDARDLLSLLPKAIPFDF